MNSSFSYEKTLLHHVSIQKLRYLHEQYGFNIFQRADVILPGEKSDYFHKPSFDTYGHYLLVSGLIIHVSRGCYQIRDHPIVIRLISGNTKRRLFIKALIWSRAKYGKDYLYAMYETSEITEVYGGAL
jgi:hypothetical protein